jgi:amidohydrolase
MSEAWHAILDQEIDHQFERMVQVRRHLHMYPETSGHEQESSFYLYTQLGDEGFTVRLGPEGLGVFADWEQSAVTANSARLALRADIDALPIHDEKSVPYRSRRDGVMHACGHDVHTAVVMGTLVVLRRLGRQGQLPWPLRIRGIFQPAEETSQGALAMVQAGALEGAGAILAAHVEPNLPAGRIGLREGVLTAACDQMLVQIHGQGGHAARPHESKDPISAAAQLINALYLHIPRVTDSQDAVVVTVGQVLGGENANVIPERVQLQGTIRTLDARVRQQARQHILRIAQGVASTSETQIDVTFGISAPSVVNDPSLVGLLHRAVTDLLGAGAVQEIYRPSMGSEDFAHYLQQLPGAMFRLGCARTEGEPTGLHTPRFDVDEEAIRVGMRVLARTSIDWFQP